MNHRRLGASDIDVSSLSLGSWKTFERITRETGVAVMRAAREAGIDFLDDARYDDDTGTAPMRTGYSEVVFGELFRAAGWKRDEVVVANKLWWEFWPDQNAVEELDATLGRLRLDYVDLIYAERPPAGLPIAEVVAAAAGPIDSGEARAWGVLNWSPEQIIEAARVATAEGLPTPCAVQLPYSLAYPSILEEEAMSAALDAAGASVVASAVLANGALSGKYAAGGVGRLAESRGDPRRLRAFRIGERLSTLAEEMGTTPSRLAITFALAGPRVASVLFGATSPAQVTDNVGALELIARMTSEELVALRRLAVSATA